MIRGLRNDQTKDYLYLIRLFFSSKKPVPMPRPSNLENFARHQFGAVELGLSSTNQSLRLDERQREKNVQFLFFCRDEKQSCATPHRCLLDK